MTKTIQPIILALLILSITSRSQYYTAKNAEECFNSKALQKCSNLISSCMENKPCESELAMHQDCTFGSTQQQIFNGYCFRKWQQEALLTKQLIDCITSECNLLYNSQIGMKELYQCSRQAIVQNLQNNENMCDKVCLQSLRKAQEMFGKLPNKQLFHIDLQNREGNLILQKIREKCIDNEYDADKLGKSEGIDNQL